MAARMYGSYPLLAYAAAIGGSILLMRIMQLLVHDAASDAHGCASADAGAGRAAFASFRNIVHHFTTFLIEKNIAQITPLGRVEKVCLKRLFQHALKILLNLPAKISAHFP